MAQATTSAPQQGVNMPAVDLRQLFGAVVASEGVRVTSDLAVTQRAAGANMSVDVAAGSAAIQDDHATGGGFYGYTLATATNVVVGAADATNPRIDRVVIRVRDTAYGDAANDQAPFVVAGTPTGGATLANTTGAAAVPGSSLLIANVLVPATSTTVTTANIDTTGASNNSPAVRPPVRAVGAANVLAYAEFTANVTANSVVEASATQLVTAGAVTFDGATPVMIEFFCPGIVAGGAISSAAGISLWEGSALGRLLDISAVTMVATDYPVGTLKRRLTPTAGSHTYSVRVFNTSASNLVVVAGVGGATAALPGYIKITRDS